MCIDLKKIEQVIFSATGCSVIVLSDFRRVDLGSLRDLSKVPKGGRCGPYLDEEISERLVDISVSTLSTQLGIH